jgi:hypothetical protein
MKGDATMGNIVWAHDERTGISIGKNRFGELFIGGNGSGANMPDTDENRERLGQDYKRYTGIDAEVPQAVTFCALHGGKAKGCPECPNRYVCKDSPLLCDE